MSRSGRSGGRSSGGSFGGNRSSGGRSGGSFGTGRNTPSSSGGFFSRSNKTGGSFANKNTGSSKYRRPTPLQPRIRRPNPMQPTTSGSGSSYQNRAPSGCGCSSALVVMVILAILIIFIIVFALNSNSNNSSSPNTDITISTIQREALPKGSVNETDYYTDELDWIGNETQLIKGLKDFYEKTGVQPYLYITDEINGSHSPSTSELDDFANSLYDELFTDEAHLLFVFFEYNGGYMDRYVCGTQAKTVIDTEAADILLDYIDRYYYDSDLTDEEFFSKSFSEAADRIMTVTRSPWITVFIVISIAVILIILYLWWRQMKKQKNIEAKQTEEMLKTPLEKFSDVEASELAKKYSDQSNNQK